LAIAESWESGFPILHIATGDATSLPALEPSTRAINAPFFSSQSTPSNVRFPRLPPGRRAILQGAQVEMGRTV
jgi:hypothetical protein